MEDVRSHYSYQNTLLNRVCHATPPEDSVSLQYYKRDPSLTTVNQCKLYIKRKQRSFRGSPVVAEEGGTKWIWLLLSLAAAASAHQDSVGLLTACLHRCSSSSSTSSVTLQQGFYITTVARWKLQCTYFKGKIWSA